MEALDPKLITHLSLLLPVLPPVCGGSYIGEKRVLQGWPVASFRPELGGWS